MKSLRDQLVATGLASKKDRRRVDQELREERRKERGNKRKDAKVEAERAAAEAEAQRVADEARAEEHRRRQAQRERLETQARVRQLVYGNRMGGRGDIRFFFKTTDGRHLRFLALPEAVAWRLRCGQAGIVATPGADDYVVVSRNAIARLDELAPELVVFFVRETKGISDPSEAFNQPVLDVSLRAHRHPSQGHDPASTPRSDLSTSAQGTPATSS